MYNPIVLITFANEGFTPFDVETTLEEVFMDNPALQSMQDTLERKLQAVGSVVLDGGIFITVVNK